MILPFSPIRFLDGQSYRIGPWLPALLGILMLSACQPPALPTVEATSIPTTTPSPISTPTPAPTVTPASFTYGVTVLNAENKPVPDAHVLIEIEGQAPLDEYADANGYARIIVPATHAERPGRLTINARGYEIDIRNIDLYQDRLPDTIHLTAKVVGNTTGFCPDDLTFDPGFEPAKEDETLVVVSNFADTLGNDPRNLTFDLVERMQETLAPHAKIRVERLNCAIKQQDGSETVMRIGSRKDIDASIVIWGVYVEPPDPEVHIYFDIVKQKETYLGAGFDSNFGPQAIQPSMFDFKASLGTQAGEVVAFAVGLALYNANEHLAAEPLFTTAIAVADQPLASEFTRALHYYRAANYWYLGRFSDAKIDLELLKPDEKSTRAIPDDLDLSILNILDLVYVNFGDKQQALDFYNHNQALLIDYYNQALPLLRAVDDKAGEAITLNTIALFYYVQGDKQQALNFYSQALPLLSAIGDKAEEATTLNNIGLIYYAYSDLEQALDFYNQALSLSRAVGDKTMEATTLNNIGLVYYAQGELEQALDFFSQALPLRRAVGDKAGEATTLNNIGSAYSALGDKQQALDFYNQALPLRRGVGDKAGEATTLNNIGKVYADLGDNQLALDFLNQALPLRRTAGDQVDEATTLNNMGLVYYAQGELEQALDLYNQALPLLRAIGDKEGEAKTLNNMGLVYLAQGELEQALSLHNQALPLSRSIGDKTEEATTLNNIGAVYYAQGELEQAFDLYNQALPLRRAVGDKAGEATTLNNIGLVYYAQGDMKYALDSYNQALPLSRAVGDKTMEATTLNNIGNVYYAQGDLKQAIDYTKTAVDIFQQIGTAWQEVTGRGNLAFFQRQLGDLDAATESLEAAITLARELNHPSLPQLEAMLEAINAQRKK